MDIGNCSVEALGSGPGINVRINPDPALPYGSGFAILRDPYLLNLDSSFFWLLTTAPVRPLNPDSAIMLKWIRIQLYHMDPDPRYWMTQNSCTWTLHSPWILATGETLGSGCCSDAEMDPDPALPY